MGIAYLFALLSGFVFAGFVASLWPLIVRREVSFSLLYPASNLLAVEVFVVVFSIPLLLLKLGVAQMQRGKFVAMAWCAIGGSVLCGFLQGVALLSIVNIIG